MVQIRRGRQGKTKIEIRRITALDAIDEAIGRATEMGRPVHFSPGVGDISAGQSDVLAGMEILAHVAKRCAEMSTDLIASASSAATYAVADEVVKTSLAQAGHPERYRTESVRFLSPDQWAYAAGVVGIITMEKVAANITIGAFQAETMLIAESAHMAGAIQVAGTTNMYQLPFFVAACDYTLLGEEMYAAGAYFSRDPIQLGIMSGEDFGKAFAVTLLVLGLVTATMKSPWLSNLIKK
jgi:hypothetical protein